MMVARDLETLLVLMLPLRVLAVDQPRGHALMYARAALINARVMILPLQEILHFLLAFLKLVCLTLIKLLL